MSAMKKFYCYVASLLIVVGAMGGCTEDFTTDNNLSNEGLNSVEFIEVAANIEIDNSRTTLIDNNAGKVIWSNGDAIGAIATDGTVTKCVATSVDGVNATFSVPANTKYAIYPYSTDYIYSADATSFGHKLPSSITLDGSAKVFDDKQNVMVAPLSDGKFFFKHLCGYIEVKLKGIGTVKHIALRSNTRKWDALSGLAYISLDNLTEPNCTFSTVYKEAFNWLYATCNNVELSKEKATSFYFVVPPRTYENLSICVQTEKGSYAISSNNAITVNRAKIRPITAIDIDDFVPTTTTDLSAEGVANCYIVPQGAEAKYYSFPAQKLNATSKLAKAAYAHVLWSDRAKLITNVNYDVATGTVSLKYAGGNKEGNAMVSVFDANHNALWTWHIWCTDQPEVVAIKNSRAPTNKIHGVMDRNLGATYAPKTPEEAANISKENATASMGLYYQYGRPIPFPKATSIANTTAEDTSEPFGPNSDCELMYGFKNNLQSFIYTNYGNSFNTMLSFPPIYGVVYFTTEYGTTQSSGTTNYYTFCKQLPMPCTQSSQLWHSENADRVSMKGNTDPCPPGYCVDEFETFKAALYNISYNRVSKDNQTYGYSYQCPTTKDVAWFPATGLRTNKGVYSSVGSVTNLWSAINCSNDWLYGMQWYTKTTTGTTQKMTGTSANGLGKGCNVRCRVINRSELQSVPAEPESKPTLSILFVGNSLTQDGIAYLPYMLKNYYPEVTFNIYMWYIGGKNMGEHYSNFTSVSKVADIFSIAENSEGWTNYRNSMPMSSVLAYYKFDIVCLQEYFNKKDSYTDCTDWNNCKDYILNNYKGGNELKFISLFHAPARKADSSIGIIGTVDEIYERTKAGNALILKNTVSEDIIPFGIAVYKALDTDLKNLGDKGQLSPDNIHTQEGLPCLLQTYVALCWIFDRFNINKTVLGNTMRMTTDIYNKISVPGANLGTGVVEGTEAQYRLAQEIAIEAYAEGKELLKNNSQ